MELAMQAFSNNVSVNKADFRNNQKGNTIGGGFTVLLQTLMSNLQSSEVRNLWQEFNEMCPENKQRGNLDVPEAFLEDEQIKPDDQNSLELLTMLLGLKPENIFNDLSELEKGEQDPHILVMENAKADNEQKTKNANVQEINSEDKISTETISGRKETILSFAEDMKQINQSTERIRPDQDRLELAARDVGQKAETQKNSQEDSKILIKTSVLQNSETGEQKFGEKKKPNEVLLNKINNIDDKFTRRSENGKNALETVEAGVELNNNEKMIQKANRDIVFELAQKQTTVNDTSTLAEETVEIQANKLTEELPDIIKARLQQSDTKEGGRDFIVELEPKALGKLFVKLTSHDGVVSVKILVEQVESKSLIDSSMQNLKQNFAEQGIKYGTIDIEVGSRFAGQDNQQQQQWFQNGRSKYSYGPSETRYYSDEDADLVETSRARLVTTSNVDYFA